MKTSENWNLNRVEPIPIAEATNTWRQLRQGQLPPPSELESYHAAIENSVAQIASNWNNDSAALSAIRTTEGTSQISVNPVNILSFDSIGEVVPSGFVRVKRGYKKAEDTVVEGIGASLLVRQLWTEEDSMIPDTGLWYPVTGLLNLDNPMRPVLELYDPTRNGTVSKGGQSFPLSANYTTAFARDFQDRQLLFLDVPALLRFEKFADRLGMYRATPFDPEKRACILIHGINSSPTTWHLALNQMFADEEVREGYEFWTFGYPTGAPIPYLASELREGIVELQAFRRANGAENLSITLIGHSMGGLLAKAATQQGGDEDWNQLFTVPIEQLEVDGEDREILRRTIYYEPVPNIDRVIFISTPHRGSDLAAKPGARLVGDLIQLPRQVALLTTEILNQSQYALTPLGLELAKRETSIDQLRPTSKVTAEFLNKPLNPSVEFYSIIGNKSRSSLVLEETTDGIVPYSSSHIEGVVSETLIQNSEHGVHRTEDGIDEIVRILKLP
ncbi:MAG: alpha/beta hydrolase [Verrucomicrobiota bacterium]